MKVSCPESIERSYDAYKDAGIDITNVVIVPRLSLLLGLQQELLIRVSVYDSLQLFLCCLYKCRPNSQDVRLARSYPTFTLAICRFLYVPHSLPVFPACTYPSQARRDTLICLCQVQLNTPFWPHGSQAFTNSSGLAFVTHYQRCHPWRAANTHQPRPHPFSTYYTNRLSCISRLMWSHEWKGSKSTCIRTIVFLPDATPADSN